MDYPRALDSSPEDRGLGVRDCGAYRYEGPETDVQIGRDGVLGA